MEDTAIVDLYWQRSDQAISETDHKYGRYCHAIAYNFVKNNEDAEECVNDTWFRAWNLMPDKRPSVLSTFLGAITRNLAISMYRGKTNQKHGRGEMPLALDELSECIPSGTNPEQEYEIKEFEKAIGLFVDCLIGAVYDKFGEDTAMQRTAEHTITATVDVQVSPTLFGWLFQFGNKMSIISPSSLKEEYTKQAAMLLNE